MPSEGRSSMKLFSLQLICCHTEARGNSKNPWNFGTVPPWEFKAMSASFVANVCRMAFNPVIYCRDVIQVVPNSHRHLPRSYIRVEKSYVRLCSSSHFSEHQIKRATRRPSKFPMAPSTTYVHRTLFIHCWPLMFTASRVLRSVTFMDHST